MKNRNSHTVGAFLKLNIKIVERGKIDTHNTQIHHPSLFWLYIDTSIKCGSATLVLWANPPSKERDNMYN
jgi:hypothetical protein